MKNKKLLIATALLTTLAQLKPAQANPQPSDLFHCARALAAPNDSSHQKVQIGNVPSSDKTASAVFVPIGRLPQKDGKTSEEFILLTRAEMSCHMLPKASSEHAAGSEVQTFAFAIDSANFHIPSGRTRFTYVTQRDNETRKLISSKLVKLSADDKEEPTILRPRSCLDPEGSEYKRLMEQLGRSLASRTKEIKEEAATRQDIRRHKGSEPGPAFRPAEDMAINPYGFEACRKINDKSLNEELDRYSRALIVLSWGEFIHKDPSRGGSVH